MQYTSEDSGRQLAQDFEICVFFSFLQMHAANYASDISELLYISHTILVDGNVKDLLEKHENT
jgi:hypothetical protein